MFWWRRVARAAGHQLPVLEQWRSKGDESQVLRLTGKQHLKVEFVEPDLLDHLSKKTPSPEFTRCKNYTLLETEQRENRVAFDRLKDTSQRRSSIEAVENVGTMSAPFTIAVINCFPDSARSQVMHAAGTIRIFHQFYQISREVIELNFYHFVKTSMVPGANATQVVEKNSLCSRKMYVSSAAVPPPNECPTI